MRRILSLALLGAVVVYGASFAAGLAYTPDVSAFTLGARIYDGLCELPGMIMCGEKP